MCTGGIAFSQDSTATSVDPRLLEWQNSIRPAEYTIGEIKVSGVKYLDADIVKSISGLVKGQSFVHPGADIFAKAINNLWKQKLFSTVEIYATQITDEVVDMEIAVTERPKLGKLVFTGVSKTVAEELQTKIGIAKQNIITEDIKRKIVEVTKNYYGEKGFQNVTVLLEEKPDSTFINSTALTVRINKGSKVRIDEVNFYGNENIDDAKLEKQMKGTKEALRFRVNPSGYISAYGSKKRLSFKEYMKSVGFLRPTKTRELLEPYVHIGFGGGKFNAKKFEEDKAKVISFYNSKGYRDAQIVADTIVSKEGKLYVDVKVEEGRKYYFGDITFKGNSKYSDSLLNLVLNIQKGDVYNVETLNRRTGKELSQEGGDISGYYQDDGYLFFQINPIETRVYNDTIDHEIRITEGPQARIKNVTIVGNERTKEHVIRRELRTVPGELFKRADLIRSQRELGNLQFFNQETINPVPVPNPEDGTVDINWKLEEKSSDQLELSAGWGGNIGITGTLGVTFNNFSIRNITKKSAWDPLPVGDGQKLSIRLQSNGRAFRSYNFSFTEPWLGGKKRNSLTFAFNNSKYTNGFDPLTGQLDKKRSDTNYLKVNSISVSYGKQLKWPDDYFSLLYTLSFTNYQMRNYAIFPGIDGNSTSNNLSLKITLQRSSVFDPIFPRSGSNFTASVQFTPPFSLFDKSIEKSANPYKRPEYHKWRFNAEWYVPIGKATGADKSKQFVLKLAAKYGFLGRYNQNLEYSPFERFQLGDAGLTNNIGILGFDIVAHRGYPVYTSSNPTINPDNGNTNQYFTIFNKYQMELRYPLVTNPGSTIYGLTFFEAANGWYDFKTYNPFKLRRSVGVGMRFFLPMFGLLGFDYGIGLDRLTPGGGVKNASKFTFMLGFEPE